MARTAARASDWARVDSVESWGVLAVGTGGKGEVDDEVEVGGVVEEE